MRKDSREFCFLDFEGPERSYDEDAANEALQEAFHLIDHVRTGRSEFFTADRLRSLILVRLKEVGILLKEQLLVPLFRSCLR